MEYVAIFEGGGAKGLAHVGALKATEDKGICFKAVGGTSAGAIMATFVAAGFSADELFDPKSPHIGLLSVNFLEFLSGDNWALFQKLQRDMNQGASYYRILLKLPYYLIKYRKLLSAALNEKGIFDTSSFQEWLDDKLRKKLGLNHTVTFGDLEKLTIISTDTNQCKIQLFNKRYTPEIGVAEAVAASIAIPFFFKPKKLLLGTQSVETNLVDGGMVSNYPTWIFDKERLESEAQLVTIGYKLVNRLESERQKLNFFGYLISLVNAALWGDQSLEIRGIENLHSIPLRVSTGTLEFDLDNSKKINLYSEGRDCAALYFSECVGMRNKVEISKALELAATIALSYVQNALPNSKAIHLRANIFIPTFHDSDMLRLMYSYNMGNDADDKLLIKVGSGAAGVCFKEGKVVLCDLVKAKSTFETVWKLNKYQQALVRTSLKSLISLPIFQKNTGNVLAVLSFDSDDDILEALQAAESKWMDLASLIHKALH